MPSIKRHQSALEYHLGRIDTFLNEIGVDYLAAYGTMLGAVRHQGFIPWDDDLDIMMTPENIIKLDKELRRHQIAYRLVWPDMLPFPKIIPFENGDKNGENTDVWIDVFPIDYLGNTLKDVRKNSLRLSNFFSDYSAINSSFAVLFHRWQKRERNAFVYMGKVLRRLWVKTFPFTYRKRVLRYQKELLSSPKPTIYAFPQSWDAEPRDPPLCYSIYKKKRRYQFGQIQIWGVDDYDTYLSHLYGDYMRIPKNNWTHLDWDEDIEAMIEEARREFNQ